METIKAEIEVTKEMHELCNALVGLVASVKDKAKDGLTPAEIAVAITENIDKLMTGLVGVEKLPEEMKGDPQSFGNAIALMGAQLVQVVIGKK